MADLSISLNPQDDTPTLGGVPADQLAYATPTQQPPAPAPVSTPAPTTTNAGIASMESGGKDDATNALYPVEKGGPLGRHQFLASTWGDFVKARPDLFQGLTPEQALAKRSDPNYSNMAADWYADYNKHILAQRGIAPTAANLGIAHALGGGGAAAVLSYPDGAKLADVFRQTQPNMADEILRLNPQYQNMTVGELKAKYAGLGGGAYVPVGSTAPSVPAPSSVAPMPPTTAATVAPQLAGLQRLAQMQKLAMFSKLLQPQSNPVQTALASVGGKNSKTAWANTLLAANKQQSNPLNTYQALAALSGHDPYSTLG